MKNLNIILEKEELTAQTDDGFKMVCFKKKNPSIIEQKY